MVKLAKDVCENGSVTTSLFMALILSMYVYLKDILSEADLFTLQTHK